MDGLNISTLADGGFEDLRRRVEAREGRPSLQHWTLPDALFLAKSVAYFEVARRSGRSCRPDQVLVDQVADTLWRRAAAEIVQSYAHLGDKDVRNQLLRLRNALDRIAIDGANCRMMDGIEALMAGDLNGAAACGAEAWVKHGASRDLVNWLHRYLHPPLDLPQAVHVMDLAAWALHEVAVSGRPGRTRLCALENAVYRASDWLLFRQPCAKLLAIPDSAAPPDGVSACRGERPLVP